MLARKYRLLRTAGFGGMAQLWVAKNESTGAEVCIKILVPERSDDESVERFRREAYAAARLSHRAIVRVFDLIELGPNGEDIIGGKISGLAIVMELLHGETLADLLMKRGKLPLEEALDVAIPFLSALAHAHRAGVVHRDVKPDNIFLSTDPDGHVIPKVLDFGVSKLNETRSITQDGVMLGTPSFMSPEQARGARSIDARSDVFSAGIVLYMMLAGSNPFESDSFHSVVSAILERQPPRIAELPDEVWAILEKALSKDPAARYADATELGIALRRVVGRSSITDASSPSSMAIRTRFDSAVSVPPVGSTSLAPEVGAKPAVDADTSAAFDHVPMRKTPTRLVAAIAGIALAIVIAAVARGSGSSPPGADVSPASSAPAPATAPVTATATATAPIASAAEAATPPPSAPAPRAAEDSGAAGATSPAGAQPPKAAPRTSAAPAASSATAPAAPRSPSEIARDPGF